MLFFYLLAPAACIPPPSSSPPTAEWVSFPIQVEGLERCESLRKLDLTVNFVDRAGLLTLQRLRANEFLREL